MSVPLLEPSSSETSTIRWMAVIFNNETTNYDLVVDTLVAATGCTRDEAEIEVWEAHNFGKAPVHFDSKPECERVAKVMGNIGVAAEVCLEWES